ncbi:MAG: radical SAM protein [Clostridiales bacterium]|nr:radical SAM protein [Clostridiales bacterium]
MKISGELFELQDEQGFILYAPLQDAIARLNEAGMEAVRRHLSGFTLTREENDVIDLLRPHRFFDEAETPAPYNRTFRPTHVTLFPSDGCNLRCRYCYAAAAGQRHRMDPAVGRAAIDLVRENAQARGETCFAVSFHGNGEPFTAFAELTALCEYAQDEAEKHGLECRFSVATNGVLGEEQLDYLIARFQAVNISFDGLPDLQDHQRPMADGGGSFALVDRTLRRLQEAGVSFGIRTTLTVDSIRRLEEIVGYVAAHYPKCDQLHIEPAWECGRCLITGEQTPDMDEFARRFLRAEDALPPGAPALVFSAARQRLLAGSFCAVSDGAFTVTAEGYATACYEVCTPEDPRADPFLFGRFDPQTGRFAFDGERLARLSRLTVENMPYCRDCFCKWHCAGDCAAKLIAGGDPGAHRGSDRCRITRALTLRQLTRRLEYREVSVFEDGKEAPHEQ